MSDASEKTCADCGELFENYGQAKYCPTCRIARSNPNRAPDPTPEQIAAACERFRSVTMDGNGVIRPDRLTGQARVEAVLTEAQHDQ